MNIHSHSKRNHLTILVLIALAICLAGTEVVAVDLSVHVDSAPLDREFEAEVRVADGTDLYGFAFDLVYDPGIVEVVDADDGQAGVQPLVTESDVLGGDGTDTTIMAAIEDGEPGTLVIGYTRTGPVAGVDVDAETVLMTVAFRGLVADSTEISFGNMRADNSDGEISASWTETAFTVADVDPGDDEDGDGLTNAEEQSLGTDIYDPDSDGDGMEDGWEVDNGLLPLTPDAEGDDDDDGLTNGDEYALGTNPQSVDSDGDEYTDREEVDYGGDPTDGDTVPAPWLVSVAIDPQEPVVFGDVPYTFSVTGEMRDGSTADLSGAVIAWSVDSGVGDIDAGTGEYLSSESGATEITVQVDLDGERETDTISFEIATRSVISIGTDLIVDTATVSIPVTLASGGGSVADLSFTLGLDSTVVELVEIGMGSAADDAGKTLTVTDLDSDNILVEIGGNDTVMADGTVATINLKAATTGQDGQCSDLTCQTPECYAPDESVIETLGNNGEVCLELSFKPGDVDRSGLLNASDIQFVINRALGIPVIHDCDINNDATVNAIDVQLVINAVLGIDIQV